MRPPPEPEAYVRVWVDGDDDLADKILFAIDQPILDKQGIKVTYLGSARVRFEDDVPEEDRCRLLFGFRGNEIGRAVDFVNSQDGVEVGRTQLLEVELLIVSRTSTLPPFELFDE
jgi:hypothetical protein